MAGIADISLLLPTRTNGSSYFNCGLNTFQDTIFLLQVKSGTIFDSFLITNDPKLAEEVGNETWGATKVRLSNNIFSYQIISVQ